MFVITVNGDTRLNIGCWDQTCLIAQRLDNLGHHIKVELTKPVEGRSVEEMDRIGYYMEMAIGN